MAFGLVPSGCLLAGKTDEFDSRSSVEPTSTDVAEDESDGGTSRSDDATDDGTNSSEATDSDVELLTDEATSDGNSATEVEPEPDCQTGDERCPCYPNDTCNDALTCLSGLCVDASNLAETDTASSATNPSADTDAPDQTVMLEDPTQGDVAPPASPPDTTIDVDDTPNLSTLTNGTIGSACETDDDCNSGFRCMQSSADEWLGGGPAGGYCTRNCLTDPSVCTAAGARCVQVTDTEAFCLEACDIGVATVDKCHGRSDIACDSSSLDIGFCRPTCRSDADCGDSFCDLGTGACVDTPRPGDPIGAECDPDATEDTCASGLCLPIVEGFAVCTGWCNLSEIGCGSDDPTPSDPGEAICTFAVEEGSGSQDLGFCMQRCNCDDDCLHPDGLCLIVPADIQAILGTAGLCLDPDYPDDDPEFTLGQQCE